MKLDSSSAEAPIKRTRFTAIDPMELESAMAKLAAAKEKFGREIRVFQTSVPASSTPSDVPNNVPEEPDDFYEFTTEDYYRLLATKKEDKYLKTKKIREAEEAARRAKITKAVVRVRFPDNYTLEVTFHPSETIQCLFDLLVKVIAHPELPFYIYTTPPKKQIKDVSQDFFSAGFIPGAIVYFSYDLPKGYDGAAASGPYLQEEVMSLQGLESVIGKIESGEPGELSSDEPPVANPPAAVPDQKPADKKKIKPKWLKL